MLYKLNFYILVFSLVFGVVLYDTIASYMNFTFTDELLVLLLFVYWVICGNKKNKNSREFLLFSLVALFYLCYSLYRPHNVSQAIFMDFLIQIKPFVAFYTVSCLDFRVKANDKLIIRVLCITLALLLLPVGILYVDGTERPLYDLMGHPSRYATACQVLGVTYFIFSKQKSKDLWISLLIIAISVLSLRSKAFGFCGLFFLFVLFREKIRVRRLCSLRNILMLIVCFATVLFLAWEKFEFYFIIGSEYESARPMLYSGGIEILKDYPFFGTGFGSYAEYASSVFYSPLYREYGLALVGGLSSDTRAYICDTFFPALAQVGYVGIFLFFYFWFLRIKIAQNNYKQDRNIKKFGISAVIVLFFMIESIADSTFTHNRGIVMMMLLAMNSYSNNLKFRK